MSIIRPIITEKSMKSVDAGRYTFLVDPSETKRSIAALITSLYKVTVLSVSTSMHKGKSRRVGKKMHTIKLPNTKRAVVQVQSGQTIDAFQIGDAVSEPKK